MRPNFVSQKEGCVFCAGASCIRVITTTNARKSLEEIRLDPSGVSLTRCGACGRVEEDGFALALLGARVEEDAVVRLGEQAVQRGLRDARVVDALPVLNAAQVQPRDYKQTDNHISMPV